ncbi:MAG: ATP-binding protein [Thermoplasmata archaeon]|nr:ATP-binding protein [Thermoplasmata archaeon]
MVYYVVIRGPLGIGKSTVSERLAKATGAEQVSVDRILEEPGVDEWDDEAGHYSERCFLRTSELAAERAKYFLDGGTPVIFDGNFYWRSQIADLVTRLSFPHYVFTLKAPLALCVQRDSQRDAPHGREATESVYAKSTEFDWGVGIDATQSVADTVSRILAHLPG